MRKKPKSKTNSRAIPKWLVAIPVAALTAFGLHTSHLTPKLMDLAGHVPGMHLPQIGAPVGERHLSSNAATADFSKCPQFFFQGKAPKLDVEAWKPRALCYDAFAIYHSGKSHTPIFVAEKLSRASVEDAGDEVRTNKFFADARLPSSERAELEDYKNTGYDRGHLAPAGDMPSAQAMAQSFSLANMVPQVPENNRGVWAKSVEGAVRKYAMRAKGDIYVITGPHYAHAKSADPKMSRVWVPDHLYKLVYDPSTKKAWAYWVPNTAEAKVTGVISYEALVKRTGIEFLPPLTN